MTNTQRFRYAPITNMLGQTSLRPLLPIVLQYETRPISVSALLDSGADVNVLPYRLGIELGANWDQRPIVPSLSGKPDCL